MAYEVYLGLEEVALGEFAIELVFLEQFEDLFKVLQVLSWVLGVDKDVIQVDNDINIQEWVEDHMHEGYEGCRGICESKR